MPSSALASKLQVFNTALLTAQSGVDFAAARHDPELWGRLTESAVGAHLANAAAVGACEVFYWRERSSEVDLVVRSGRRLATIEVKSGRAREARGGLVAFAETFGRTRLLLVGGDDTPLEEFLRQPVGHRPRS